MSLKSKRTGLRIRYEQKWRVVFKPRNWAPSMRKLPKRRVLVMEAQRSRNFLMAPLPFGVP